MKEEIHLRFQVQLKVMTICNALKYLTITNAARANPRIKKSRRTIAINIASIVKIITGNYKWLLQHFILIISSIIFANQIINIITFNSVRI